MKVIMAALMLVGLLSQVSAQTNDCRGITSDAGRLACYDKAAGEPQAQKGQEAARPANQATGSPMSPSSVPTLDSLDAENRRIEQKIRSICRNC